MVVLDRRWLSDKSFTSLLPKLRLKDKEKLWKWIEAQLWHSGSNEYGFVPLAYWQIFMVISYHNSKQKAIFHRWLVMHFSNTLETHLGGPVHHISIALRGQSVSPSLFPGGWLDDLSLHWTAVSITFNRIAVLASWLVSRLLFYKMFFLASILELRPHACHHWWSHDVVPPRTP